MELIETRRVNSRAPRLKGQAAPLTALQKQRATLDRQLEGLRNRQANNMKPDPKLTEQIEVMEFKRKGWYHDVQN